MAIIRRPSASAILFWEIHRETQSWFNWQNQRSA
jgi:hypothetical protein